MLGIQIQTNTSDFFTWAADINLRSSGLRSRTLPGWAISPALFRSSVFSRLSIPWLCPNYCWTSASLLSLVPHKSALSRWYFRILYIFSSVSIVFILPASCSVLSIYIYISLQISPASVSSSLPGMLLPELTSLLLVKFRLLFYLFKLLTADTFSLCLEISLSCLLYLNETFSRINWF